MKMPWILYSIIAMISLAFLVLAVKKASDLGTSAKIINLYIFGIVFMGFLVWNLASGEKLIVNKTALIFLIIASIFSLIANFLMFSVIGSSPNPGYVTAIIGLHGVIVLITSIFLFNSEFNLLKIIGSVLAVVAIILISL